LKASCRQKKNVDGIKSKKQRQLQSSASANVFDNADDAVAGSGDVCGGGGGDAGNYVAVSLPKNTTDISMANPKLNDAFDNSEDDDSNLYKSSGSLTPPGEKHPGIYLLCTSIPLTIISWHTLFVLAVTKFRKSFRRAISEFSHQPNTEKLYYALLDDDCEGEYQGQRNSRKMPNGLGRFCALDGMVYEGYWKKGKYHGTGWMMTAHQPKYQMLF